MGQTMHRKSDRGAPGAAAAALLAAAMSGAAAAPAHAQQPVQNWMRDYVASRVALRTLAAVPQNAAPPDLPGLRALLSGRIVGGGAAGPADNPFQVALLFAAEPDAARAQFCGGTLLTETHVVTAAHCSDFVTAGQVQVLTGARRLDGTGVRRNVRRIAIHPGWNAATFDNDAAVWELDTPAAGTAVASLATEDGPVGANLLATGWGATSEGGPGAIDLQRVAVPLADRGNCNDANSYGGQITDVMLCAGVDAGGVDSCQGDSGGPLTRGPGNGTLTGITSWGTGCARPNLFGVYTRVSQPGVRRFIEQEIAGGGFSVGTFRPWAGYAIPNGVWLGGDLNGDRRSDLVHLVNGTDYVHTWTSNGDGTFAVGTFSPWAGYAVPNGDWLAGDLNRDGRTDLVHLVNGTDYVHTWMSNGDGTFAVGTFSPWAGYAVPNGGWRVADLNADGRADLVHLVEGADYVHTWMSNGDGTFAVGTFSPWAGYAVPNGDWMAADLNGDRRTDLVHLVNGTDYVHTWMSNGDGTFAVGTFSPWAGYAVPNGPWRVADLNADGRADLVHLVNGADYAHPWLSNGDGTFVVGTFSPWAGYAFPNGEWAAGDLNADGRGDLIHLVKASDYVHPWTSNGDGTFAVGTFSPWAGYAIPNGVWVSGDLNADGRTDLVHLVDGTDYVHPWIAR
jgi:uncharacterized protein YjaZ